MLRSIRALSFLLMLVGLCLSISFTLQAQTTQPANTDNQPFLTDKQVWKAFDRPRNVKKLRFSGPRFVYKDEFNIAVHAPKKALKPGVNLDVVITKMASDGETDIESFPQIHTFSAEAWPPENRRHPRQKDKWFWRAETTVSAKGLVDGKYVINLRK